MKIAAISVADVLEAIQAWPSEQRGLYLQMLLKMYARSGPLPDDDGANARMFGFSDVRTYKTLKARLVESSVLTLAAGEISNDRAMVEVASAKARKQRSIEAGRKGGRPRVAGAISVPISGRISTPIVVLSADGAQPISTTYENPSPSPSPTPTEGSKEEGRSAGPLFKGAEVASGRLDRPTEPLDELKSAFNGASASMLADIQRWARMPEPNARRWLATTLGVSGQHPTAQAYQMLVNREVAGDMVASPLAFWGKTAGTLRAKQGRSENAPAKPTLMALIMEGANEPG